MGANRLETPIARLNRRRAAAWMGAAALASLLLALGWRATVHPGGPPAPVTRGPAAPRLSLTFDVTWGDAQVLDVLDALGRLQVKATFFVSGPWAVAHPDVMRRLQAGGHEIGVLGWRVERLSRLPGGLVRSEVARARDAVGAAAGREPRWFRPPFGDYDTQVLSIVRELGLRPVTWTVDGRDEGTAAPHAIASRVVGAASAGSIIRLRADDGAPATDEALTEIVETLRGAGYAFVTVNDLLPGGAR